MEIPPCFNQDLKSIEKDLSKLNQNFSNLEAELAATKQVNNVLRNQMDQVERKSWSNDPHSRRECLEILEIQETVTNSSL